MGISHRTVEVHRASLMTRLGARNLAEAVRMGLGGGPGPEPHAGRRALAMPGRAP